MLGGISSSCRATRRPGAVAPDGAGHATTCMTGSTFLDTNVVVYAFDDDEPVKQKRARAVIGGGDHPTLVVSTQVLAEFFVTVTRKLERPLAPDRARQAVADLATLPVVGVDKEAVLAGIDLADRHQLSLWDALIVQAAATAGCETLLTEDLADGAVLAGVSIHNPFV
jgi:predicted nucleic acid-binding protein